MDCKAASELIMKYLDRKITNKEEQLLYEHLDSCEDCSLEFETLKDACMIIEDMGFEEPPFDLEKVVISRIKKEDAAEARIRGWMKGAAVFTAIVAGWIGIMCLFLYTPALSILMDCFYNFLSLSSGFLKFAGRIWREGLSASVKLLTVGRAFGVVQRALIGMYSVVIVAMIVLMAVILNLYGYMFKSIRR